MAGQAGRLAYAHGSAFTTEPLEAYAAEVAAVLPVDDPAIYPVSGGSEAIETALKLVRAYHLARGEPDRDDRRRPARQLSRQHARGPGPVGPSAVAPAVRAVAGPVPARLGGVPVPGRRGRGPRPRRWGRPRRRARGGPSPRRVRVAWRPSSRSPSSGRRSPRRCHRTTTGRRRGGLRAPRGAAGRRRGDDRVRPDGTLVRTGSLGRPARPPRRGQGGDVGLLAVRVRRGGGCRCYETVTGPGAGFVHGFTYSHAPVGAAVAREVLRILRDERPGRGQREQGRAAAGAAARDGSTATSRSATSVAAD